MHKSGEAIHVFVFKYCGSPAVRQHIFTNQYPDDSLKIQEILEILEILQIQEILKIMLIYNVAHTINRDQMSGELSDV